MEIFMGGTKTASKPTRLSTISLYVFIKNWRQFFYVYIGNGSVSKVYWHSNWKKTYRHFCWTWQYSEFKKFLSCRNLHRDLFRVLETYNYYSILYITPQMTFEQLSHLNAPENIFTWRVKVLVIWEFFKFFTSKLLTFCACSYVQEEPICSTCHDKISERFLLQVSL